jgi:hypothetical protein
VGLQYRRWNLVVLRYGAMHPEYYRLMFCRKIRSAHGALYTLNAHMGPINYVGHNLDDITKAASAGFPSKFRRKLWSDASNGQRSDVRE